MRRPSCKLIIAISISFLVGLFPLGQKSSAYDDQVYQNLLKSRDALSRQQTELQTAYDDTKRQIDDLNSKLTRIDGYLRQVSNSLKDVDTAIQYTRR